VRDLSADEAAALSYGKRIARGSVPTDGLVAGISADGTLIALLEERATQSAPVLVFAPA